VKSQSILRELGIQNRSDGACYGSNGWVGNEEGRIASYSPLTDDIIAEVKVPDRNAYDIVVGRAVDCFTRWKTTPAPARGNLVRDLGQPFRHFKEPLAQLISFEMGKILEEALGEVQEMIDICDFAQGLSRQLHGITMHSERPRHRMYEHWHPLGPVGVITAFNFPIAVWSWNATISTVCGDTVVWKPSSDVPLCAIAVQNICNEVMAAHRVEGLLNLLVGSGDRVGERMINDPRFPLISFTGSCSRGKQVAETVARRLGRSLLELGGNNGILVTENADLEIAVRAIVFGAVGTSGQRCTSTRRIIVHHSIIQTLSEKLVDAYRQVRIGDPLEPRTLMGPLISSEAVDSMMNAIDRARVEGGRVLCGGNRLAKLGKCFVEPTIIMMDEQTELVKEETFAPILYLIGYQTLEEAIELHNSVKQGLSSAIMTTDLREAEFFLSHAGSDCGIANVNLGTSGAEIGGAFGGEKETGGGREAGSDAWKNYMRRQTTTINWGTQLPLAQGIRFDSAQTYGS
jgi:aldehyde dehydrogenase (NAD+)